jgi:putative PEP-CTERM system histidine kinase
MTSGWTLFGGAAHLLGACAAATLAAWMVGRRHQLGPAALAFIGALVASAVWALTVAVTGGVGATASTAESVRNLAWLYVVYRLFSGDGRHQLVRPVRPVMLSLAAIELFQILKILLAPELSGSLGLGMRDTLFHMTVTFRLMLTIGGLVLLHNLYGGASQAARAVLRWPTAAIALLWLFDLNLYTVSYLTKAWPEELATLRGIVLALAVATLTPGMTQRRAELRFSPSRAVAFEFASLLGIGLYLVGMILLGQWLSYVGGEFARMFQFGFLIAGTAAALLILPSRRLRGWLKVTLVKHLFQHRYDYRAEWLRFNRTISGTGGGSGSTVPLAQRAIQSLCDITDAPAGLLLTPDEHGDLVLAARWQWPTAEVPAPALGRSAVGFFERHGHIVDLEAVRNGVDRQGEQEIVPEWLLAETRAWAMVPLLHYERLHGVVVLALPPVPRTLDWEDFDVLRVVGQQLASYLAENAGQDALAEAAQFDEFNRRIAFVMHDIKNLASQFGLLARNAELHADNPAFRADMIVTLRNSTEKLNALIARLSRYGKGHRDQVGSLDAGVLVGTLAAQFAGRHPVIATQVEALVVTANRDALEQSLVHLVQNAIDASANNAPVTLSVATEGDVARIEVSDAGTGMSPEFIRNRLFKPFVSSKAGGFGIGAFEARELIRAMGGRLDVESREGLGSRFIIRLPLAGTSGGAPEQDNRKVA